MKDDKIVTTTTTIVPNPNYEKELAAASVPKIDEEKQNAYNEGYNATISGEPLPANSKYPEYQQLGVQDAQYHQNMVEEMEKKATSKYVDENGQTHYITEPKKDEPTPAPTTPAAFEPVYEEVVNEIIEEMAEPLFEDPKSDSNDMHK